MMSPLDPEVVSYVREAAASDRYGAYLRNALIELCAIDTVPQADLPATAVRERKLFDWIEREIGELLGAEALIERPRINPRIADDPAYTPPLYAADARGRVPPVEQIYADRGNLLAIVPGGRSQAGPAVILHAHVDVVPPWSAPRSAGERVFGRGTCDNKAQVALLLAQMKLLREVEQELGQHTAKPRQSAGGQQATRGRRAACGRVYQFVIDEEIGGNGSLSQALDTRFAATPVLIHECTNLVPYCAHRGAVWYRCRLSVGDNKGIGAVELVPFVVQALEAEGRQLRPDTDHSMFTAAHVQTNHGVLGRYGTSPASVCDHVAVEIVARSKANPERVGMKIVEFLEDAVADYVEVYGDKTRENDPATGRPKVERHFDVKVTPTADTQNFRVDIWGKSGHMGSVAECDGAITKAAYLLGGLLRVAPGFPAVQAFARLAGSTGEEREVVLEGGQGFTPSHTMADVQARMIAAARRGVQEYCQVRGCRHNDGMVELNFDRLHNDAYADDPEIAPMQALRQAFHAIGEPWPELTAWQTSCDARIYHTKGHPVAIFGAGKLENAHSDDEYIDIPDVQKALAISTLATWAMIS